MSTSSKTPLTERIARQAVVLKDRSDAGVAIALRPEDAATLLERPGLPEDIRTKLAAIKDRSRTPPTQVLLKPSVFLRLAESIAHEPADKPTAAEGDVS